MDIQPFSISGWSGELNPRFRPSDLEREVLRLVDPASALKTLHWGRNYLYLARMEGVDVVVKQFRHNRLRPRLDRRLKGSKAERSWRVARALLEAGILTPEPVMRIESVDEAGPALYVCRFLDGAIEARYLLRAANAGTEREQFPGVDLRWFLGELGRTARKLHEAGFWFRDFTSGNVLLHQGSLHLVDLNRARTGKVPSLSERMRDLSRMPVLRPEHQEIFLSSYWGGERRGPGGHRLYLLYHHAFLLKNRTKQRVRGGTGRGKALLLPRTAHAHIPGAPAGAPVRDRVVWDHLSDQPHQHAGRLDKLRVRLADARSHLEEGAVVAAALPRIRSRYRELKRDLHREPVPFQGCGVALRPWPEDPGALLGLVDDLGARHVLLRLHPWEEDHGAEEELARELHGRGLELTFALPQNRELVKDPARWRRALEEIGPRFSPYGKRFQVGQAINRSKWGIWNLNEYVRLVQEAAEILRREPGVEILGPSVIDFEHHATAAVLNLRRPGLRFDAVSALLYVDRRGAPENPQAGFDTEGKVLLLKAIADTARNSTGKTRCWITEVNWPLKEGPHSPAGQAVAVGEPEQADYLVRYYLLSLGTGAVERVFWWQMIAKGYGLVDPVGLGHLRRRPAFAALRELIRELEGSRLESVLPVAPPARLRLFRRPDGERVAVAWSTAGTVRIALPDGREVEAGSSPRYFRLPAQASESSDPRLQRSPRAHRRR